VCSAAAHLLATNKPSWGVSAPQSDGAGAGAAAAAATGRAPPAATRDQGGQCTAARLHRAWASRCALCHCLPRCLSPKAAGPESRTSPSTACKCLISHAHMPTSTRPRPSAMAPALATRRSCSRSSRGHTATRRLTRHLHQALMLPRFRLLGDCTRPLEAWPCGLQCRLCRKARQTACQSALLTVPGHPAGFTIVVWDGPHVRLAHLIAPTSAIPKKWACG
jgi:hypothetical protein